MAQPAGGELPAVLIPRKFRKFRKFDPKSHDRAVGNPIESGTAQSILGSFLW
jgi:hypothetical protein